MTFDHPYFLIAFVIFIPLFILDFIRGKNRRKLPEELERKLRASVLSFRAFLAFAIIALSCPRWGTGFASWEYRRGLDIVFAIDISRSMDIRDAQTGGGFKSRLERGVTIAKESIALVPGARYAAAVGRGKGYLSVPLTYDNEAAMTFLQALDGSSMTGRSTNLESLVEAAADAFQSTSAARKVIVLISDGESHYGSLRNAIHRCTTEGIIVNTVVVGSDEGRPVPSYAQMPGEQVSEAISRRDAVVMRTAAERGGGIFIDAVRDDSSAVLASHLLSLAQEIGLGNRSKEQKQRRSLFIILAIIAYGASKFILRLPKLPRLLPLASILFMTIFLSSCRDGKFLLMEANYLNSRGRYDEAVIKYNEALNYKGAAPYAEYGLALTFYSLDEGNAALIRHGNSQKMLEGSSPNEHRELHFRNHYNSGIIFFEQGEFQSAANAFREALRAEPGRLDAKRNLELALMSVPMETDSQNKTESRSEQMEILFEYIRQEEEQRWRSREWAPEENHGGPDY